MNINIIKEHLITEKFNYLIILLLLITNGVVIFFFRQEYYEKNEEKNNTLAIIEEENAPEQSEPIGKIKVDIKGQVKKPGVYEFEEGDIVNEAITKAGGLTKNGVTTNINLSKKLTDEMIIIVYTKNELSKLTTKETINCPNYNIENCTSRDNSSSVIENGNNSKNQNTEKISINTATKEALMTLPGIGEAKAESIIAYRSEKTFEAIEDIKNVSGIGDSIFAQIKDYITV